MLGLRLKPGRVAAALVLSAGTHWWADRRMHLKAVADAIGKGNFHQLGGPLGGAYALDLLAVTNSRRPACNGSGQELAQIGLSHGTDAP
ncbi:hypothetical protein ACFYO5_23860 [Streptomyces sp. NPDC006259]|uniref:hypothetical protein n=1 Tax=Streptomyces sp. NPDC006259 TaxID=3364740 RepID=UPI00367B5243